MKATQAGAGHPCPTGRSACRDGRNPYEAGVPEPVVNDVERLSIRYNDCAVSEIKGVIMARIRNKTAVPEELPTEFKRKLKALKEVAGLLSDLSPEEMRAFLETAKRRPLFGDEPSKQCRITS